MSSKCIKKVKQSNMNTWTKYEALYMKNGYLFGMYVLAKSKNEAQFLVDNFKQKNLKLGDTIIETKCNESKLQKQSKLN